MVQGFEAQATKTRRIGPKKRQRCNVATMKNMAEVGVQQGCTWSVLNKVSFGDPLCIMCWRIVSFICLAKRTEHFRIAHRDFVPKLSIMPESAATVLTSTAHRWQGKLAS